VRPAIYEVPFLTHNMREPSDTTPNPGWETDKAECENCGTELAPLEWVTLETDAVGQQADPQINEPDDTPGYNSSLHFCDEECLEEWKAEQ
jgi:hypothetical protein